MADDPLAQFFEGESDPISKFFGKGAAPSIAPPPSLEELRAQRVRTASPKELRNIHFGENIPVGQQQDQRSVVGEALQGALIRRPAQMIGGTLNAIPEMIHQANNAKPPTVGQLRSQGGTAALGGGMTPEAGIQINKVPVEPFVKLATGTPTETGEAAFDVGATLLPMKGAMAEGIENSAAKLASERATRHAGAVHDSLMAGLGINPNDQRAITALQKGVPILRSMTKSPRPFRTSQSFANFADRQAAKYFETHHENLADALKGTQVTVGEDQMALSKALEERASLNKRLNKYDAADPKTQGIMEETNPKLQSDLDRRSAIRDAINSAIDTAAPQSSPQADIMRNYSHLKEVAEIAVPRAQQLEAMRAIARGSREPIGTLLKDTAIQAATGTLAGRPLKWTAAQRAKVLRGATGTSLDPEIAFGRASRRFQYVKPAETITPKPIPMTTPVAVPAGTQGELPLVPQEVGTVATSQQGAPVGTFPNELTQQFNQPLNVPAPGQQNLQFVPEGVGTAATAPQFNPEQSTMTFPNELTQRFNQSPQLPSGQQQIPFAPTLASTPETVGGLGQTFPPYQPTGPVQIINGVPYERVQGGLRQLPANFRQPAPTISPVPTPAPISGGAARVPAAPGAPVVGSPPMTEEEFVNAMSQPDVNIVPRSEMERRVLDRIASGYSGPERRAVEVPEEFKGKITDYNRRKKSAALYRRQYEKPPR